MTQIEKLKTDLASARSHCTSAQAEASNSKADKNHAERDAVSMGALLRDIAVASGFDVRRPLAHLPHHIRCAMQKLAA